ncbi:MAG TPA: hypothetical protein VM282_13140 [Acidimicrobiales bacterium]|nr:hypothetical protein [Acidimicrobiales bacterium]
MPDLVDLGDRLANRLGATVFAACTSAGSMLDLNTAAVHTLAQIDLVRRELATARAGRHSPGGLSNRAGATRWAIEHGLVEISTIQR